MRKIFFVFLFFMIALNLFGESDPLNNFRIQLGTGADILAQNFDTLQRGYGLGGTGAIGYKLDESWSFWVMENIYVFPSWDSNYEFEKGTEADLYETIISARYTFGGNFIKPYLTAGFGFFYEACQYGNFFKNYYYLPGVAQAIQSGLGVEASLFPGTSAFIEAKGDFVFANAYSNYYYFTVNHLTAIDIPINVGVILNL